MEERANPVAHTTWQRCLPALQLIVIGAVGFGTTLAVLHFQASSAERAPSVTATADEFDARGALAQTQPLSVVPPPGARSHESSISSTEALASAERARRAARAAAEQAAAAVRDAPLPEEH